MSCALTRCCRSTLTQQGHGLSITTSSSHNQRSLVLLHRYYTDGDGKRVYTLKVSCLPRSPSSSLPLCPLALPFDAIQQPVLAAGIVSFQSLMASAPRCPGRPLSLPARKTLISSRTPTQSTATQTLQKLDGKGRPTYSAHPARFSPDDKYSRHRVTLKKRFGILLTQSQAIAL